MTNERARSARRLLLTAVAVLAATGVAVLVKSWLSDRGVDTYFVPYVPAVAVAALYGGLGAGIAATITAVALEAYLFLPPRGVLFAERFADQIRILLFLVSGVVVSVLGGRVRRSLEAGSRDRDARERALELEREARARAERLAAQGATIAALGEQALSGVRFEALLVETARQVAVTLAVPIVSVVERQDDALRLVGGVGWPESDIGVAWAPVGEGSHSGYTLMRDEPVVVDDFRTETRFHASPALAALAPVSGIGVRIGGAGDPYGVLLVHTREPRRFSDEEVTFLRAVGNVLGAARARDVALGELRGSRDQLEAVVRSVTDAITVQTPDGRLLFANDEAARLTGYRIGDELVDATLSEGMGRFELLDEAGEPLPADELPGRRALRGERAPERLVRFRIRETGQERWSVIQAAPVFDEEGGVRFAVNIFRDVTERQRRDHADRFLSDATGAMTASLDESALLDGIAALATERVADWCVIDVRDPDGKRFISTISHQDPERAALGRQLRLRRPFDPDGHGGAAEVIRTGEPLLVSVLDVAALAGEDDEWSAELGRLGLRSLVCVPLRSGGRILGALSLLSAESGQTFDEHDLAVAAALGERTGVALENIRLYQAADARRRELTAVLAAMGEAVLVYDDAGQLVLRNPAAAALFRDAVPARAADLRRFLDVPSGVALPWEDATTEARPVELRARDGRWLELSTYRTASDPVQRSGRREPSILVVRDVTEPRSARAARDAFMGMLSHELRTPITTIYGGTRLLDRPLSDAQRREVLDDVRAESERLYRLVEDLLVMTRVERGGVEIGDEPILLQRLLPTVARAEQDRWPGLDVSVRMPSQLPAVRGDLTYVEQVVRNLVTNAAKYAGTDQAVELVAEDLGSEVAVRILDRGPGIAPDEAARLFDLFYRGAATASSASGAGIGLFVCRALVTAMGGRIWASPRPGGGSEFAFSLPVLDPDDAEIDLPPADVRADVSDALVVTGHVLPAAWGPERAGERPEDQPTGAR